MRRKKCMPIVKVVISIIIPVCILFVWTRSAEEEVRYAPDYPMEDISVYLERENLTEEEYDILYRQTGLTRLAVDAMLADNRSEELLAVQERFFAEVETRCEGDLFLFGEVLETQEDGNTAIPALEDGDILITFNSHFLGWRNGHVAIVTDADKRLTVEAITVGTESTILSVDEWSEWPSFVVLRLCDMPKEQRAEVADYAEEKLVHLPYHLTAGTWDGTVRPTLQTMQPLEQEELSGTHCAHLVWYAYNQFGYDLDSDGGLIVTPEDLYGSPLLEVVQVYGMKPD